MISQNPYITRTELVNQIGIRKTIQQTEKERINREDISGALRRHLSGDWGDLPDWITISKVQ